MELRRVKNICEPYIKEALKLYEISFPKHEQREAFSQINILDNPLYHFDVILDNDEFVGEILYWDVGDFLYIEHLCILPEKRNNHYGQRALQMLQNRPLILEIDPPKDEISVRRKGFYERCGFVANSHKHIHPPYHEGYKGHELVIMSSPKALSQEDTETFQKFLSDVVMKDVFTKEEDMKKKICQSCGMSMTKDQFGTNSDGSTNELYCKYCYKDGEFIDKVSMEEYIDMCSQFGSQAGMTNDEMRDFCNKLFPTLLRWKK